MDEKKSTCYLTLKGLVPLVHLDIVELELLLVANHLKVKI